MNTFLKTTCLLLALAGSTSSLLAVGGNENPFGAQSKKAHENQSNVQKTIITRFLDGDAAIKTLDAILNNEVTGQNGLVRQNYQAVIATLRQTLMGPLGEAVKAWRMAMLNRNKAGKTTKPTETTGVENAIKAVRQAMNRANFNTTGAGQALITYLNELESVIGTVNNAVAQQPNNEGNAQLMIQRVVNEILNGRGTEEQITALAEQVAVTPVEVATALQTEEPVAPQQPEETKNEGLIDMDVNPEAYFAAADAVEPVNLTPEALNAAAQQKGVEVDFAGINWLAVLQLIGAYPDTYGVTLEQDINTLEQDINLNRMNLELLHNHATALGNAMDTEDPIAVRSVLNEITDDNGRAYDAYLAEQERIENASQTVRDAELARRLQEQLNNESVQGQQAAPAVVQAPVVQQPALQMPAAAVQQIQGGNCGKRAAIVAALVAVLSAAGYAVTGGI